MSRIFLSTWWLVITVIAFVIYGGTFPSNPRTEPGMHIFSLIVVAIGYIMTLLTLGAWVARLIRRGHKKDSI